MDERIGARELLCNDDLFFLPLAEVVRAALEPRRAVGGRLGGLETAEPTLCKLVFIECDINLFTASPHIASSKWVSPYG
jgi:hypothetical protein